MKPALKVAITGAAGRMGRSLLEACANTVGLEVGAAIVRSGNSLVGSKAGDLIGKPQIDIKLVDDISSVLNDFDVLID